MQLIEAYKKILSLQVPIFTSPDIAINLQISNKRAGQILLSLTNENFIVHLRRNLWGITHEIEPFMLPEFLTAPLPSYISLQSALYYHGMISQISSLIYAMTIARTRIYQTSIGNFSVHHISPDLFFGYEVIEQNIKMASPEKALFDFLYLKSAKSKNFFSLPELEVISDFDWDKLINFSSLIKNVSRASMVLKQIAYYRQLNR